ncbi:MAG: chemotaxis protein CheX [Bdellovibrionales bacterium]|nr:chemotaxis protein CheX [Bdellovibrionales bacterium]
MKQVGQLLYIEATTDIASKEESNTVFKDFDEIIANEMKNPWVAVVIDLKNKYKIVEDDLKHFSKYIAPFRKAQKKVYLLHGGENIKTYLQEQGLNTFFQVKNSINDIKHLMKVQPAKQPASLSFNVNMVNPIISSAIETLKTQCQVQAKPGAPTLKEKFTAKADLFANIKIESNDFNGYIFFAMPEKTFLKIMGNMLGEDYEQVNDELLDGMAELLNIVYGNAKKEYKANGISVPQVIPSVVKDQDFKDIEKKMDINLVLPFSSDAGDFFAQVSYKNQTQKTASPAA